MKKPRACLLLHPFELPFEAGQWQTYGEKPWVGGRMGVLLLHYCCLEALGPGNGEAHCVLWEGRLGRKDQSG